MKSFNTKAIIIIVSIFVLTQSCTRIIPEARNFTASDPLVYISWDEIKDADYYEIAVSRDLNFTDITEFEKVYENECVLNAIYRTGSEYFYRIRAVGEEEVYPWSGIYSFVTEFAVPYWHDFSLLDLPYEFLPYTDNVEPFSIDEFLFSSTKFSLDTNNIVQVEYDGKLFYNPVTLSQVGLYFLDNYIKFGSTSDFDEAVRYADKLIAISELADGKRFFPYSFDFSLHGGEDVLVSPWYSGMAQGQALSFFSRLYESSNNVVYANVCRQTFETMRPEQEKIASTAFVDDYGCYWIDEYPMGNRTYALNGFLFSIFGLYDYYRVFDDSQCKRFLRNALVTSYLYIDLFRHVDGVSYYCLRHKIQSAKYHQIHIDQLEKLFLITGEGYFKKMAATFYRDYN